MSEVEIKNEMAPDHPEGQIKQASFTGIGVSQEKIIYFIKLVRNPKVGKGFIFNLTDNTFVRAVKPVFAKGKIVEGYYQLEHNKYYLVKEDRSSWKNSWEHYQILTVANNEVKVVAKFQRNNGNYEFEDKQLEQLFLEFNTSEEQKNVINFASFLIQKLI